jgi:hypothetical protein|nr:S8 family serine peptidase [Kofleriaceae bacterium]
MPSLRVVLLSLVSVPLAASLALAAPPGVTAPRPQPVKHVCNGVVHCMAQVRAMATEGKIQHFATPQGFGPADLQDAYKIDVSSDPGATVAVVDAFGYASLESDLATYRSTFGLPACTTASGCLKIVGDNGGAAPTGQPPADDDWTIETALDVDMVSSGCPKCKIIVVETASDRGNGLLLANDVAAKLGATVISNSWGGPEAAFSPLTTNDAHVDHAGIAIFASSGDDGYLSGPADFPASSDHVLSVGGTSLFKTKTLRGWAESAWSDGGSSCSGTFAKPPWQVSTACAFRMTADLSALGDPQTGVAVFNNGPSGNGWSIDGGTSLASPLTAAIFAQTGQAAATSQFPYIHTGAFNDVTSGQNGSCTTALCKAGLDWDGPTGVGSPIGVALSGAAKLPTITTDPADGQAVPAGFSITVNCAPADSATVAEVDISIDGETLGQLTSPPFTKKIPATFANGPHSIYAVCILSSFAQARASLTVKQVAACTTASDCPDMTDLCFDGACVPGPDAGNGLGASCGGAGDCDSGICTGTGGGSDMACAIDCDAQGACPGGFSCQGSDGSKLCLAGGGGDGGGCDASGGGAPVLPMLLGLGAIAFVVVRRKAVAS